jgi:hypothetical protein
MHHRAFACRFVISVHHRLSPYSLQSCLASRRLGKSLWAIPLSCIAHSKDVRSG